MLGTGTGGSVPSKRPHVSEHEEETSNPSSASSGDLFGLAAIQERLRQLREERAASARPSSSSSMPPSSRQHTPAPIGSMGPPPMVVNRAGRRVVPELTSNNARLFMHNFLCSVCSAEKSTLRQIWAHQIFDSRGHGEFAVAFKDLKRVGNKFLCNVGSGICSLQDPHAMPLTEIFDHQLDAKHGAWYSIASRMWPESAEESKDYRFRLGDRASRSKSEDFCEDRQGERQVSQQHSNGSLSRLGSYNPSRKSSTPRTQASSDDLKPSLTPIAICSPLPRGVQFVCNAVDPDAGACCTRGFKALGDLINHQLDLNTEHGNFYEALIPLREEDSDMHGRDWTYFCPVEKCPQGYKSFSWSQLWKHSLKLKHGTLWYVALEYWRRTGENSHWFEGDQFGKIEEPTETATGQDGEWVLNPFPEEEHPEPSIRENSRTETRENTLDYSAALGIRGHRGQSELRAPSPSPSISSSVGARLELAAITLAGLSSESSVLDRSARGTPATDIHQEDHTNVTEIGLSGDEHDNSDVSQTPEINQNQRAPIPRRSRSVTATLSAHSGSVIGSLPLGPYLMEVFLIPAFKCYICNEKYHLRWAFRAHFDRVHPQRRRPDFDNATSAQNTFQCLSCPSRMNIYNKMRTHISERHLSGGALRLDRIKMREGAYPLHDRILRQLENANSDQPDLPDDSDDDDIEYAPNVEERRELRQERRPLQRERSVDSQAYQRRNESRAMHDANARHQDKRPRLPRN